MVDRSLNLWSESAKGKLVVVRMDKSTAVSYAKFGAGRSSALTVLTRGTKDLEIALSCTVVAIHIAEMCNTVADALSRFELGQGGRDPCPERQLREKFRKWVRTGCGHKGNNAWRRIRATMRGAVSSDPLPTASSKGSFQLACSGRSYLVKWWD